MSKDAQKLGNNLKNIRINKGISQSEIARALEIDRSFVGNIEKGKTNSTLSTISNLARVLNVSSSELLK